MIVDAVMKAKMFRWDLKSTVPLILIPMTLILAASLPACVAPTAAPASEFPPPPGSAPASTPTPVLIKPTAASAKMITEKTSELLQSQPSLIHKGIPVPDIRVDVYQPDKTWQGTTLFADNHNPEKPRILEVNMLGEIIWEYQVPQNLRKYTNPGFDAEWLSNDNILFVLPRNGVYEINRDGNVIWSYLQPKVSHDADRLSNNNTLMAWGGGDKKQDTQVREVNPAGETVWAWRAMEHFDQSPYSDIYRKGWTHTNAVSRLENGHTIISPRNFDLLVETDVQGNVVRTIGEGIFQGVHDPEVLPNGNILLANLTRPNRVIEYDPESASIVWQSRNFPQAYSPIRDADRLPNGNTLITAVNRIVEITPDGTLAWRLLMENINFQTKSDRPRLGLYKAERITK